MAKTIYVVRCKNKLDATFMQFTVALKYAKAQMQALADSPIGFSTGDVQVMRATPAGFVTVTW